MQQTKHIKEDFLMDSQERFIHELMVEDEKANKIVKSNRVVERNIREANNQEVKGSNELGSSCTINNWKAKINLFLYMGVLGVANAIITVGSVGLNIRKVGAVILLIVVTVLLFLYIKQKEKVGKLSNFRFVLLLLLTYYFPIQFLLYFFEVLK